MYPQSYFLINYVKNVQIFHDIILHFTELKKKFKYLTEIHFKNPISFQKDMFYKDVIEIN